VKVVPMPEQKQVLLEVGESTARLIDMENYRRCKLFLKRKGIDTSWESAWRRRKKMYREIYEMLGSENFKEVSYFISEAWKSYETQLEAIGQLTALESLQPPGYRKSCPPIIIICCNEYEVDLEKKMLRIRLGLHRRDELSVPFEGELKWLREGKKGRLVIRYDTDKKQWYADIFVLTALAKKAMLENARFAGIDLGREILAAVATDSGEALLYNGEQLSTDYRFFEKGISNVDEMLARAEGTDKATLKELRRWLYEMRESHRDQTFANVAKHIARELKRHGVSIVFIGYPEVSYCKLIQYLSTTLEDYDIAAFAVDEYLSSRICAWHGCNVERIERKLVKCPYGHIIHGDINAALNHMKRGLEALGVKARLPQRIHVEYFIVTPSRIIDCKTLSSLREFIVEASEPHPDENT